MATLASGFIRVLGCTADSTPSPSPTPTPADANGGASSTPTPNGGVQAITTSVPATGAGSGWLAFGAALVVAGAGLLIAGTRRRRGKDGI